MLNKKAVKENKVVVLKEARQEEAFVYVCGPVSGKRYRFYYKRLFKFVAKYVVVGAVAVTTAYLIAYLMLNAFLNAWDVEYKERMDRLEEYQRETNQFKQPDVIFSEEYMQSLSKK